MSEVRFIASRLEERMKERDVSDGKLAEMTGIGRTTIYYLRKGKRRSTSAEYIAKIADALSTSTQFFIDEDADASPIQKKMSALVADIAGIAEGLSPGKQRQLRELGNALVKMDQATDVDLIYSELMDMIARLTELEGGNKALRDLITHVNSLSSQKSPSAVQPRSRRGSQATRTRKSTNKPAQGDK